MTPHVPFPTFQQAFREVHGTDPYTWQTEFAAALARDEWPTQVDVPTGLGKTSVIFACVYELARQRHNGGERTAPMRIFHVVDRRSIIDDAAIYARGIAQKINGAGESEVLSPVRESLASLLGPGDHVPVEVSGIHGDHPDDRAWLRSTGCAIVSLTSHQFTSRLLFRGIGLGENLRPIAAGLCGVDRVVLFDEPHLSEQSVHTIRAAEKLQSNAPENLQLPSPRTILLGATVPGSLTQDDATQVALDPSRETSVQAQQRLDAQRTMSVQWVPNKDTAYVDALVEGVRNAWEVDAQRTVVFVNTVDLAQKAYAKLSRNPKTALHLVTSRFRPFDRQGPEGEKQRLSRSPLTVISTQALEVGVDYTFDALVTEMAPWPTLVQRLGRLNRDGASPLGEGTVVASWDEAHDAPSVRPPSASVYGEQSLASTTELLRALAPSNADQVDLSFRGIQRLADSKDLEALTPTAARVATLHSGLLPLLTHTRPTPNPDLPWGALISGPDAETPVEVSVAWRADLSIFDATTTPPHVNEDECVSVSRIALESFLNGAQPASTLADMDANETTVRAGSGKTPLDEWQHIRVWDPTAETWRVPLNARDAARAPRIVMHPNLGGYTPELGWTGSRTSGPVDDVSIRSVLRRLLVTRPSTDSSWTLPAVDVVLSPRTLRAASSYQDYPDQEPDLGYDSLAAELETSVAGVEDPVECADLIEDFARDFLTRFLPGLKREWNTAVDVYEAETLAIIRLMPIPRSQRSGSTRVPLDKHSAQVGRWAAADGIAAGLKCSLTDRLGSAGQMHDAGKARREWQLNVGNHESDPVAKSVGRSTPKRHSNSLLEPGWRHEMLSVALLGSEADPLERHLVGAHHGWYRPVIRPVTVAENGDMSGYPATLEHSGEFAELNQRYGPWGLAYLEAVLRLADWRASAQPDNGIEAFVPTTPPNAASNSTPPVGPHETTHLAGLSSHPMTGWFVSVGLLSAAWEMGDQEATLCWRPMMAGSDSPPVVPVVQSTIPLRDVVEHILTHEEWSEAQKLADAHGFPKGMGIKNQKWNPSHGVRPLVLDADEYGNGLLLSLASDLHQAEVNKDGIPGALPMSLAQIANNSSYPQVALRRTAYLTADINDSVQRALDTLTSLNAGYAFEQCDGGMDRAITDPGVNGLGIDQQRLTRAAVAPLALFGSSRVGVGLADGAGVAWKTATLPLPEKPLTYPEFRALTNIGPGNPSWNWTEAGLEWVYSAHRQKKDQYELIWVGAPMKRAELNRKPAES